MGTWSRLERWKFKRLLALVGPKGQPNLNELSVLAKSVRLMELNVKAFGYDLAHRLAQALPPPGHTEAHHVGLKSKASTQADIESDWTAHWASELKAAVVYHRKLWEVTYVLQAIYEHGHIRGGAKGLGFGCGVETLPSYLAAHGVSITVTDLPQDEARAKGWVGSNQHVNTLDQSFHPHLVERAVFDERVDLRFVDMNAIPADLEDYDFCWSMCAIEHLGSIAKGLTFLEESLRTLRPGGLSVHTMEYNVEEHGPTIDNWPTILFQRKHLEELAARLRAQGHEVAAFDFDMGHQPMDRFIDIPPWQHDLPEEDARRLGDARHLKLGIDGFVATCFGIIIRKAA